MTRDPKVDAELADLATALAHNPKTRKGLAGLVKEAGLGYRFNDVEAEETVLSRAKDIVRDELASEQRKADAAATERRLNDQRQRIVKSDSNPSGRFTEEVVKNKLEPFMQEKGIADYNDAAILFAHNNPPENPKPEIATKGIWDMPSKEWLKDPRAHARQMAHQAVSDVIANRR